MDKLNLQIDKKSMLTIKNGLDKLYPRSRQVNRALASSLKQSAKPLKAKLEQLVPKDKGLLASKIGIFPSKRNTKAGRPSVYVGPKVIDDIKNPAEYFYILEYGFNPGGGDVTVNGLGLLPKVAIQAGSQALALLEGEIYKTLNKRSMKLFGKKLK